MPGERLHRRRVLELSGAALAAATAGCLTGTGDSKTVSMTESLGFDPETVRVSTGGTVRWVNDSDIEHTVTADGDGIPAEASYFASGDFDSEQAANQNLEGGLLANGETYEHTFEQSGTYEYYCIPHEGSGMVGTVTVE